MRRALGLTREHPPVSQEHGVGVWRHLLHPPPRFVPDGRRESGNQGVRWNRQLHGGDPRVAAFGLELQSRAIEEGFPPAPVSDFVIGDFFFPE